jgi:hypothetical protein
MTSVEGASGRHVASTGGYSDSENSDAVREENVANASLIAAAPEMLAALEVAESFAWGMRAIFTSPNFTDRYGDGDRAARMIARIESALRSARGES